jgi:hypothetical protein
MVNEQILLFLSPEKYVLTKRFFFEIIEILKKKLTLHFVFSAQIDAKRHLYD